MGPTVFVYSSSTLLDREPPTRPVPRHSAVRVDHNVMWLAGGFDKHLYFCIGFFFLPAIHGSECIASLTAEGFEFNWTFSPVSYLLELCETTHTLD